MMWRVIDLDGPVLDGKQRHYACYRDGMKHVGKTPLDIDAYWNHKRDHLIAGDTSDDAFRSFWLSHIEEPNYLALDRLQPEADAMLADWHSAGNILVLVTMRQHKDRVIQQLRHFDILEYFSDVVVTQKADKEANLHGMDPAKTVWIGDTEIDAQAAERFGCKCYLVENGLRSPAYLAQFKNCTIVESISKVTA